MVPGRNPPSHLQILFPVAISVFLEINLPSIFQIAYRGAIIVWSKGNRSTLENCISWSHDILVKEI